jgi:hypothetical protein
MNRQPVKKVSSVLRIELSEVLCSLPGGTNSLLVKSTCGKLYTLKSPNNPQGPNVLANEWLAGQVFSLLALPNRKIYPHPIAASFVRRDCPGFLGLLSDFIQPIKGRRCFEILPAHLSSRVVNSADFWSVLVLDVWCCSADRRQALFVESFEDTLTAIFFDNGHLFGGPAWSFDRPANSVLSIVEAMYHIGADQGRISDWIFKIRSKVLTVLPSLVRCIPNEWYDGDVEQLLVVLRERASQLEVLVQSELDRLHSVLTDKQSINKYDIFQTTGLEAFHHRLAATEPLSSK